MGLWEAILEVQQWGSINIYNRGFLLDSITTNPPMRPLQQTLRSDGFNNPATSTKTILYYIHLSQRALSSIVHLYPNQQWRRQVL
ncbi:hypothetical protein EYF80_018665 [Liparis tanakae]|uniref:Uncharacterized protein n=1 Tax=Liparis tanakae TaxID=230148 RepID=A0A4Z2I0N3_9TELE|nr:hypothetical protein EYF80_018665 [Liparis tanakae]